MKKEKEEIKLIDDPNLVEYRKDLEGWTGPDRLYYGKGEQGEERARYANSTHKKCSCGSLIEKTRYRCGSCVEKSTREKFLSLEEVEWDGKSVIATYDDDMFFSELDDAYDYCTSNDVDIEDLMLVLCVKENRIDEIDIDELNEEYRTESDSLSELHPEIAEKVKELNELIRNTKPKLWFPTNKRIKI